MFKNKISIFSYILLNLCIAISSGYGQSDTKSFGIPGINQTLFLPNEEYVYPISINPTEHSFNPNSLVSTIRVIIDITHPNPSELEIKLRYNKLFSVTLHNHESTLLSSNESYNTSNTQNMKDFSGKLLSGDWELVIKDNSEGNVGQIKSWIIQIDYQEPINFVSNSILPFFNLQTDGLGSFGDQDHGTFSGAIFQPTSVIELDNTIFHSVLYLHNDNLFLSTYDMYPVQAIERNSIEKVIKQSDHEYESTFSIERFNGLLKQNLIENASNEFRLNQTYNIIFDTTLTESYYISRYINSKLNDQGISEDKKNYPAINRDNNNNFESITFFNEFIKSVTEYTTYIEIGIDKVLNNNININGFLIEEWNQFGEEFPNILIQKNNDNIDIYPTFNGTIPIEYDSNSDEITDPGKGFDAALLIGIEIPAGVKEATFTTFTTWGYSSLSEVLQLPTLTNTPIVSTTPTPVSTNTPVSTPTPIPTFTFTQTPTFTNTLVPTATETNTSTVTPTATHTSTNTATATNTPTAVPTPTTVNEKPQWVKQLPDLRFIQNKSVEHILNLDEYVYDPDTASNLITYSIIKPNDLPLVLRDRSILTIAEVSDSKDFGFITIQASDGNTSIAQNIRVKVSSILTKSYFQIPPIVLQPGEPYFSEFSLDDFVIEKIGEEIVDWSINNTVLTIDSIDLTDDNHIILQAADTTSTNPQLLSFIAQRGDLPTSTPTFTPIPTATFTPSETPTPTQTHTPTQTPTPTETITPTATSTVVPSSTPMPTSTNTATASPTFTNTATPTQTPTPQRTAIPSVTPTPSPTPTLGCSLAFNFNAFTSFPVMTGPVEIVFDSTNTDRFYITHLDDGSVGFYDTTNNGLQETGTIQTQFGSANTVFAELNNDGTPDAIVFNVLEEQLEMYTSIQNDGYQQSGLLTLNAENIPTIDALINGYRYRGMTLESSENNSAIVVLRTFSDIIRIKVQADSPQFTIISRTAINGRIRFIQSADLDHDGDRDIVAVVNTSTGIENLLVYELENNTLTLQNTIRIDTDFEGNFARDVIIKDFNNDGLTDFGVLTFSDTVRIYGRNGNGSYSLLSESNPFPPGVVVGIDAGDLDGNGSLDIVALHEDQNGLNLYVICGNSPLQYTERILIRIQNFVLQGQDYHLRLFDLDDDNDEDIIFTRSFFDDLITVENLLQP